LHDNIWLPVKVFIPEKMLQIKQNMWLNPKKQWNEAKTFDKVYHVSDFSKCILDGMKDRALSVKFLRVQDNKFREPRCLGYTWSARTIKVYSHP
jgi:hypothetical protein